MSRHKVYVLIEGYVSSDDLDMFTKKSQALANLATCEKYDFRYGPPDTRIAGPMAGEDFPDDYRPSR